MSELEGTVGSHRLAGTTLVSWVLIAVGSLFVLLIGGSGAVASSPEMRVVMQLLTIAVAMSGLVLAAQRPTLLATPVLVPLVAFVLVAGLSTMVSERPATSTEALALAVIAAPAYLAVRAVAWDVRLQSRVRWLVRIAMMLLLVLYALQVGLTWLAWWAVVGPSLPPLRPGFAALTLGSTNHVAAYLYLLGPLALVYAGSGRRSRPLTIGGVLLLGLLLVATGSRGAWLGVAIGALVGGALLLADGSHRLERRYVMAGAVGLLVIAPLVLGRISLADAGRLELWSAALGIGSGHPLLGAGIGTWQELRPTMPIIDANTVALSTPHDSIAYIFAELGVAGLIVASLFGVATIRLVRTSLRGTGSQRRTEVAVIAGTLTALVVHSLVDPLFHLAGVMLVVFFLVARLDEPAASTPGMRPTPSQLIGLGLAGGAVMLAAVTLARVDAAMLIADQSRRPLVAGRWADAAAGYDQAVGLDDRGVYRLGAAVAKSRQGDQAEAEQDLERLRDLEPFTFVGAQLARLALASGDTPKAIELARQVIASGSYDPTATINAAYVLHQAGDDPAAIAALASILVAMPALASPEARGEEVFGADVWSASIEDAVARSMVTDPLVAAEIALEAGDPARAVELAEAGVPSLERAVFLQYAGMHLGLRVDLDALRQAIIREPTPRSLAWFGVMATESGATQDERLAAVMGAILYQSTGNGRRMRLAEDDLDQLGALKLRSYPEGVSYRHGPAPAYSLPFVTIQPAAP